MCRPGQAGPLTCTGTGGRRLLKFEVPVGLQKRQMRHEPVGLTRKTITGHKFRTSMQPSHIEACYELQHLAKNQSYRDFSDICQLKPTGHRPGETCEQNLAGGQRAACWKLQAHGPGPFQNSFRHRQAGGLWGHRRSLLVRTE